MAQQHVLLAEVREALAEDGLGHGLPLNAVGPRAVVKERTDGSPRGSRWLLRFVLASRGRQTWVGPGRLNHAFRPQVGNCRFVVAEAPQDRFGMLAKGWSAALDGAGCLRQPYRHLGDGCRLRRAGELGCLEEAHGVDVRILKGLLRLEHRS